MFPRIGSFLGPGGRGDEERLELTEYMTSAHSNAANTTSTSKYSRDIVTAYVAWQSLRSNAGARRKTQDAEIDAAYSCFTLLMP